MSTNILQKLWQWNIHTHAKIIHTGLVYNNASDMSPELEKYCHDKSARITRHFSKY